MLIKFRRSETWSPILFVFNLKGELIFLMTNIKHKLKHKYNAWLFKKYGFERGPLFENVPTIYKMHALWSPSEYARCENDEISKYIKKGIRNGELYDTDFTGGVNNE